MPRTLWLAAMPAVFVCLWATGFIGARFGMPYSEPFTFLMIRFAAAAGILVPVALLFKRAWPCLRLACHLALAGILVHAVYLGGVFAAIKLGLSAGLTALIVGLQPLLTATLVSPMLGETVTGRQWSGLWLGLAGVTLVVWEKIGDGAQWSAIGCAVIGLFGITVGTLYQKRACAKMDLITGSAVQFAASTAVMSALAIALETRQIDWTTEMWLAMTWSVGVLSIGAISLLVLIIKHGDASRVASLFYLVPPVAAVQAWAIFGEQMGLLALFGFIVTAFGVALVVTKR